MAASCFLHVYRAMPAKEGEVLALLPAGDGAAASLRLALRLLRGGLRLGVTVFAPDVFCRQLTALAALVVLRRLLWAARKLWRAGTRTVWSVVSPQARYIAELKQERRRCKDYGSFREVGERLDAALGLDRWKRDDNSRHFDARRLRERTQKYKELMERGDVAGCLFALRQELLRKHFGVCNPRLFEVCNTGTKVVVEQYVDTVSEAMTWAAFEHHEHGAERVPLAEKLAFFTETKHSFGRCALLLSGGASLGMYHFGVVKALHQNGFLPRIISGTSAGAIVCGMICGRTDEELLRMWDKDFQWAKHFNFEFFGDVSFKRFLQRGGEGLYSSEVLERALRDNIGELTFLEAFDRTGRICNITVSGVPGSTEYPMLLNYLTSPHVLIWSAALASAAVPGVFEARELLAKQRDGHVAAYLPGGLKWRDGSMQNDLPMTRLTELFNVNYFIVSQVNPQATLVTGGGFGSRRGPIFRVGQFLRRELKQYLLSIVELGLGTGGHRVSPWLRPVGCGAMGLLVQEYEGDITIYSGRGMREVPCLLTNGSEEMLRRYTAQSEWETWWSIPQIENACKIEFVMDEILKELRTEVLRKKEQAQGDRGELCEGPLIRRMISKDLGVRRLPSFHRDLVQLMHAKEEGLLTKVGLGPRQGGSRNASTPLLAVAGRNASGASIASFGGGGKEGPSSMLASSRSLLNLLAAAEAD